MPLQAGHHRHASETPFNSETPVGLLLYFCDFPGGGVRTPAPPQPPLDTRMQIPLILPMPRHEKN